ncbi:MAG: VWA domain-containing protein, partial [Bacteroidetes bacterium]|nr:VWA domain-containing protein [Bacteroidota bacterium]
MRPFGKSLCIVLLLLAAAGSAQAGVLYARLPGTESPVYNLRISHIRTSVTIVGQLAVTHVDEEFFNDNARILEGFYAFQLPEGAQVDGLWLWVDGVRRIFIVKKKEEAERLYDSVVVGQRRDPAILESLGKNRFQLKVFPINPHSSRRIELQYFHTLPLTEDGTVHYRYPLNLQGYQSTPVENTELRISVESKLPIEEIATNFDDSPLLCRTTVFGDHEFRVDFGSENTFYSQDFELSYKPRDVYSVFPALSWHDPDHPMEDSYFICWHPEKPETVEAQPRDLVFVLDASGSMTPERIATVRDAVISILRKLRLVDRFRIVLFSHQAMSWPENTELLNATAANIQGGVDFITRAYYAGGSTNYEIAFRQAFDAEFRPDAVRRMLFLTDGMPNSGVYSKDGLLNIIESIDTQGVGIYPVIVYSDRIELLYDIAAARGGKVTMVENGDGLETVISRIMLELDIAAISQPVVSYEGGQTWLVYPESFPPYAG